MAPLMVKVADPWVWGFNTPRLPQPRIGGPKITFGAPNLAYWPHFGHPWVRGYWKASCHINIVHTL